MPMSLTSTGAVSVIFDHATEHRLAGRSQPPRSCKFDQGYGQSYCLTGRPATLGLQPGCKYEPDSMYRHACVNTPTRMCQQRAVRHAGP